MIRRSANALKVQYERSQLRPDHGIRAVKLWIVSDLHIELSKAWDLLPLAERPDFDVMIVAGDLTPRMERGVEWLRERITDRPVIYIAGNHEFYRCDIDRTREKAKEASLGTNIFVLENEAVILDGVRFVGATLWTDFCLFGAPEIAMRAAATGMNDFRLIRKDSYARRLLPVDTVGRHIASRAFIETQLSRPFPGPTVVITHHAPYPASVKPGYERDILSAAYASDLRTVIAQYQPDVWIYGHTHRSDDTQLGKTRLISNAKGYGPQIQGRPWENPAFDPFFAIEMPVRESQF